MRANVVTVIYSYMMRHIYRDLRRLKFLSSHDTFRREYTSRESHKKYNYKIIIGLVIKSLYRSSYKILTNISEILMFNIFKMKQIFDREWRKRKRRQKSRSKQKIAVIYRRQFDLISEMNRLFNDVILRRLVVRTVDC